jgi:TIR domain
MDYKQGLTTLRKRAEGTDWFEDFLVYEARLLENLHQERLYGSSEQTRATRAQIIDQLNRLAYEHFSRSFTDLCQGSLPDVLTVSAPTPHLAGSSKQVMQKQDLVDPISQPSSTNVFIAYSHRDKKSLQELRTHLAPYIHLEALHIWDDTMIHPGAKWREEITNALQSAKVAILLISPAFLASDFIASKEIPPLLKSAEQNGLKILPIILRPCAFLDTPLAQFQSINTPSHPLSDMTPSERDKVWISVATSVKKLVQSSTNTPSAIPSVIHETFRKIVEKESQSSVRGRVLGTLIVCTSQEQDDKTVVHLLEEAHWINGRLGSTEVAYAKNYRVDNQVIKAAIFREVLPRDYMIWIHPDHPASAYVSGGQTILVIL